MSLLPSAGEGGRRPDEGGAASLRCRPKSGCISRQGRLCWSHVACFGESTVSVESHPSDDVLAAFAGGRLGESQIDEVAVHLKICDACQKRIEAVEVSSTMPWAGDADLAATQSGSATSATSDTTGERPPLYGQPFGDYEIFEELGRGGMGVVYRARQISLNRPVALKMIRESRLASSEQIQRFQTEAEAAARLNHPGIVPVYEIGQHDGNYFFSMGLFEAGSLEDLLAKGPLPPRRAAEIVGSVARTVHFAHSRNIVHRDLKPANVLLDELGQARLTDFGLAKDVASDSQLTYDGQVMGTPSYMSPEQAAGRSAEVGPLSDVYSLGAILFRLVTNRPPFPGRSILDTLQAAIHEEPQSPRQFNEHVDLDLSTICLKCLEKDPARRYPSAAELADDLDRYCLGEPIGARPISRSERIVRWCRAHPKAVWGTLLTVALMATAVVCAGLGLERQVTSFEQTLDGVAQRSLRDTAKWVASAAEQKLREKFRHVQTAAGTPELRRRLAERVRDNAVYGELKSQLADWDRSALDRPAADWPPLPTDLRPLQSWISANPNWESEGVDAISERLGPPLWEYDPDEVAENVLAWWICGPDGCQLARDPWRPAVTRDFAYRSYFTGLPASSEEGTHPPTSWRPGDGPRLSAVFRTKETNYWVLAISAPVWDDGQLVGVVGMFLQLGSLLEPPEPSAEVEAVGYAVLLDPRPDPETAKIIEHPYHHHPSALRDNHLREDVGTASVRSDDWQSTISVDPFGHPDFGAVEQFGGRWRTAWADVQIPDGSGSKLVALVRESEELVSGPSRRLRTNLRWLGLAVVGLFVLPLLALVMLLPEWRTGYLSRTRGKLPPIPEFKREIKSHSAAQTLGNPNSAGIPKR